MSAEETSQLFAENSEIRGIRSYNNLSSSQRFLFSSSSSASSLVLIPQQENPQTRLTLPITHTKTIQQESISVRKKINKQSKKYQPFKVVPFSVSALQYQIPSSHRYLLSPTVVVSLDWFLKETTSMFDMEFYSEFIPVETVNYYKNQGIVELSYASPIEPSPLAYECLIYQLNSLSSMEAKELVMLLGKFKKNIAGNQFPSSKQVKQQQQKDDIDNPSKAKKLAMEQIEQLDSNRIFTYNIYKKEDNCFLEKISQGYSMGFLKMIGASVQTFVSTVLMHKGFEVFSSKSRHMLTLLTLYLEIQEAPHFKLEKTTFVRTLDDFLLNLIPYVQFIDLETEFRSFVAISYFDVNVNQLEYLDKLRREELAVIEPPDFRHQCQVANFLEKFYPDEFSEEDQQIERQEKELLS